MYCCIVIDNGLWGIYNGISQSLLFSSSSLSSWRCRSVWRQGGLPPLREGAAEPAHGAQEAQGYSQRARQSHEEEREAPGPAWTASLDRRLTFLCCAFVPQVDNEGQLKQLRGDLLDMKKQKVPACFQRLVYMYVLSHLMSAQVHVCMLHVLLVWGKLLFFHNK